ncbi:MAG: hypothetical protein ACOYNY_46105, partial [Caldilineaceae bacterium]
MENFELFVTHNGDFDYWPLFGRTRTQREVGLWLWQVLGTTHAMPGCDSVKVAGVMELLRTQGVWEHALRLAYQVRPRTPSTHARTHAHPSPHCASSRSSKRWPAPRLLRS